MPDLRSLDYNALMQSFTGFLFNAGLIAIFALILYFAVSAFLRKTLESQYLTFKNEASRRKMETTISILISSVKYLLLVIAVVIILSLFPGAAIPTAVISGVLGAALGFGAQSLLKDLIAGFSLVFEAQYVVGDNVEFIGMDIAGEVTELRLRTTVLRDEKDNIIHVPNGDIKAVRNFGQTGI